MMSEKKTCSNVSYFSLHLYVISKPLHQSTGWGKSLESEFYIFLEMVNSGSKHSGVIELEMSYSSAHWNKLFSSGRDSFFYFLFFLIFLIFYKYWL